MLILRSLLFFFLLYTPLAAFPTSQYDLQLTEKEQRFINEHQDIVLGAGLKFEPFVLQRENGSITGHDADLVELINRMSGLNMRIVTGVWSEIQAQAERREIDGLSSSAFASSRLELFNPSDAYLSLSYIIIVKAGNPGNLLKVEDLNGKRLVLQKDNLLFAEAYDSLGVSSEIVHVDTIEQVLMAISSGSADYCILDESAFFVASRIGIGNLIEVAFSFGDPFQLLFWFRKDWPELVSIVNKALTAIPIGRQMEMRRRWFQRLRPIETRPLLTELDADEKKYLAELGVISVCIEPDSMPLEGVSDDFHHLGIASDYLKLVAAKLGLQVRLKLINKVDPETCDLISLRLLQPNARKPSALLSSSAYLDLPLVLATRKETSYLQSLDQAKGQTIALVPNSPAASLIQQSYGELHWLEVDDTLMGLRAVSHGEAFGLIDFAPTLYNLIYTERLDNIQIQGAIGEKLSFAMAVEAKHPQLYSAVQKALNAIAPLERNRIFEKWVALSIQQVPDYSHFWKLFAGFLLVLMTILFWYAKLKQAHAQTALALHRLEKMQDELKKKNLQLEHLTHTDRLTQLCNRSRLDECLNAQLERFRRYQIPCGLVMIDIDKFKLVNDSYGHLEGDKVLQAVAECLARNVRKADILGRWGGEEFMLICPGIGLMGAGRLAEKLRAELERQGSATQHGYTASFGAAEMISGDDLNSLLSRADQQLYLAKDSGRNTVYPKV